MPMDAAPRNPNKMSFGVCLTISLLLHAVLISLFYPIPLHFRNEASNAFQSKLHRALTVNLNSKTQGANPNAVYQVGATKSAHAQIAAAAPPYRLSPLSRLPELLGGIQLDVELPIEPLASRQLQLRLAINRYGKVTAIQVLHSTLTSEIAVEIVRRFYEASYRPGEIDNRPVDSEMLIAVEVQDSNHRGGGDIVIPIDIKMEK